MDTTRRTEVPAQRTALPPHAVEELVHSARVAERDRLARDLHDSVTHALFAVHQRAQLLERALARGDDALVRLAAQDLRPLAEHALGAMRDLVDGRRAAPDGLAAALAGLATRVRDRDGLAVRVETGDLTSCPPDTAEHLLHVAAEALHNAAKHGGATAAEVRAAVTGSELVLAVEDDGRGFSVPGARVGHGLRGMRERAVLCGGWTHVDSAPGGGTRVVVRVPLPG